MAAVVVDLDGTIIDSTKRHYILLRALFQRNHVSTTFDSQDYLSYKRDGHNNHDFLTKKLNINSQLADKIQNEWINNIESQELIATDSLYPDAIPFLNGIKDLKHNIIFLTSRQSPKILHKEIKDLGLATFPKQVIVVQGDKTNAFHGILSNQKIMVGDTEVDYKAAKESNATSYILGRGFRSPRFLHNLGINNIYNNLNEIIVQIRDTYH